MKRADELLDEIHKIREKLYKETKNMKPAEKSRFYNNEANRLLQEWGVELKEADYLLKAVSKRED